MKEHPKFFAWVHLYDPHDPYEPPGRYAVAVRGTPVRRRGGVVGRARRQARPRCATRNRLRQHAGGRHVGSWRRPRANTARTCTATSCTSRHCSVPLVVRGPGSKPGTRLDTLTRSVDLFPTLVDLAGIRRADAPTGVRSKPGGGAARRDASTRSRRSPNRWCRSCTTAGATCGRCATDAGSTSWRRVPSCTISIAIRRRRSNLADQEPARARAMRAGLEGRLRPSSSAARATPARDARCRRICSRSSARSATSAPADPTETKASGADPKDKLEEYKALNTLMRQGLIALREGRPAETLEHFGGLARRGVDSFEVHYYRGRAFTVLKRWREAEAEYAKALEKLPAYSAAWRALGESRVALRDLPGAAAAYEKLVSMAPRDALARMRLGEVYRDLGRTDDSARLMRRPWRSIQVRRPTGTRSAWCSAGRQAWPTRSTRSQRRLRATRTMRSTSTTAASRCSGSDGETRRWRSSSARRRWGSFRRASASPSSPMAAIASGASPLLALVALVTFLAFLPLLGFPFLNWDDQDVFVRNDALRAASAIAGGRSPRSSWSTTSRSPG